MIPFCDFDDVVIVDRSFREHQEQQYYLIRYNLKFFIRRLDFGSEGYVFNIENSHSAHLNTINTETEKDKLDIIGIIVFRFQSSNKFMR